MRIYPQNNTHFTGKKISGVSKEINDEMPHFVRYLAGYKNRMGEKQDIYINAIGNGVVAPIFIRYNMFSKADDYKKKYSALRQTAMVLTGVIIQTLVTLPLVNRYLDKQIEKGAFGEKFTLKPENIPNIKAFKRVTNLIAIFAVIPLSVTLMNKWYPYVMDKFAKNHVMNEEPANG